MANNSAADIELQALFKVLLEDALSEPTLSRTVEDVDFDQITRIKIEIEHIDERFSKRKIQRMKKKHTALSRREDLQKKLAELEAGHDEVAKRLQVKASGLRTLPREMRDAIFEQLYNHDTPIRPAMHRYGSKTLFKMRKDPALYMSQRHVGPVIAEEAAEIFYSQNFFDFAPECDTWNWISGSRGHTRWGNEKYDLWLDTDLYGSGVKPRNFVRKIQLHLPTTDRGAFQQAYQSSFQFERWGNRGQLISHADFERLYNEWLDTQNSHRQHLVDRDHLQYFLDLDGLQEFHIVINVSDGRYDQILRLINPLIRQFQERRIKVKVMNQFKYRGCDVDVTPFFDAPSPEDSAKFQSMRSSPIFTYDEKADPLEAWWTWARMKDELTTLPIYHPGPTWGYDDDDTDTIPPVPEAGPIRVWLQEHYEVFKFYQKHRALLEQLDVMRGEMVLFRSEELAARKKYYGRILDLMIKRKGD